MISPLGKKIKQDRGIINKDDGNVKKTMGRIIIRVLEEASRGKILIFAGKLLIGR